MSNDADRYAAAGRRKEIQAVVGQMALTNDDVVAMMQRAKEDAYQMGYERGYREGKYQRQKEE